mmetsp:Transcript_30138/g.32463  ORF Transcript_30138/g.32463 Transcript_30138/m.32463 type:complete len:465 (-) Transcript_30138:86-1480(-)
MGKKGKKAKQKARASNNEDEEHEQMKGLMEWMGSTQNTIQAATTIDDKSKTFSIGGREVSTDVFISTRDHADKAMVTKFGGISAGENNSNNNNNNNNSSNDDVVAADFPTREELFDAAYKGCEQVALKYYQNQHDYPQALYSRMNTHCGWEFAKKVARDAANDAYEESSSKKSRHHHRNRNLYYPTGSLIKICDLVSRPELNGIYGIIQKFHNDLERYEVAPSRHRHRHRGSTKKQTIAIKPENVTTEAIVTPSDEGFRKDRIHKNVAFWPSVRRGDCNSDPSTAAAGTKISVEDIAVQGFDDWPDDWTEEERYLIDQWGWKEPKLLSGIENNGCAKPDFQMYFDVADRESTTNDIANVIANNVPDYEHQKIGLVAKRNTIRGVCILLYSPTKSTIFSSGFGAPGMPGGGPGPGGSDPFLSGNPDRSFSLEQIRDVLHFQRTPQGRRQYRNHDDPKHRVFGDIR